MVYPDYEDLILERQENRELAEDGSRDDWFWCAVCQNEGYGPVVDPQAGEVDLTECEKCCNNRFMAEGGGTEESF